MATSMIEVESYGQEVNAAVFRLPSRRNPGILIQGDSLKNLLSIMCEVEQALKIGDIQEAGELAREVRELLQSYDTAYQTAVAASE
jgi:hypothetical protein